MASETTQLCPEEPAKMTASINLFDVSAPVPAACVAEAAPKVTPVVAGNQDRTPSMLRSEGPTTNDPELPDRHVVVADAGAEAKACALATNTSASRPLVPVSEATPASSVNVTKVPAGNFVQPKPISVERPISGQRSRIQSGRDGHPPFPPSLYGAPLMVPAMGPPMQNIHSHALISPFITGMGDAPPPPPPPPPPPGYISGAPPCAQMSLGPPLAPPMNVSLASVVLTNSHEMPVFSSIFADGPIGVPSAPRVQALQPKQHHSHSIPVLEGASVSVGNASLAALVSKEPPKFSCVLLSGISAVGKTELGRALVEELQSDGLGWFFFSGADLQTESMKKKPTWEVTAKVFDALGEFLDELLEQQKVKRNIKGLVVDKNVKGVEDIFYLAELLKTRSIPFVGIVGMEADNEVLLKRMGGDEDMRDKLKYQRVIHFRIRALAGRTGMYHEIDATKSKQEVINSLRTMVLGCCAQPPQRSMKPEMYLESGTASMVSDYTKYHTVVSLLFSLMKWAKGNTRCPLTSDYIPFTTSDLSDRDLSSLIRAKYGVRRLSSGTRHLLLLHDGCLYLIPVHLRAILQLPARSWLGRELTSLGHFVLEGDLVRLSGEQCQEKFLVFDVLFWSDVNEPMFNKVASMNFDERRTLLSTHLEGEKEAPFPSGVNCIVVHQVTVKPSKISDLLEPCDYPVDGLVFPLTSPGHSLDKTFVWRSPDRIVVDFRIGALTRTVPGRVTSECECTDAEVLLKSSVSTPLSSYKQGQQCTHSSSNTVHLGMSNSGAFGNFPPSEGGPIRTYKLEVYDKAEKEYTQFENCTVDVKNADVVEGCICACVLVDKVKCLWEFQRLRYDVARPAYKKDVISLLNHSIISRVELIRWLSPGKTVPPVRVEVPPAQKQPISDPSALSRPPCSSAPPTYANAIMMQAAISSSVSEAATPSQYTCNHVEIMTGCHRAVPAVYSPESALATCQKSFSSSPLDSIAQPLIKGASQLHTDVPRTTSGLPTSAGVSTVELLSSMFPGVSIRRNDGSREVNAQSSTGAEQRSRMAKEPRQADGHVGTGKRVEHIHMKWHGNDDRASQPQTGRCAKCSAVKGPEDLRYSKDDEVHYCYRCWADLGCEFCSKCKEFGRGCHERTRKYVGSFFCNKCWDTFNIVNEPVKGKIQNGGGRGTYGARARQGRQRSERSQSVGGEAPDTSEVRTVNRRFATKPSGRRPQRNETKVPGSAWRPTE
ncbi:hypothetical protein ERJ75_000257400 [Trypanosoma vivax]|uniref:Uncharacterized protein n=1 Tax=Trypanosoma vivax (strain Y486) TaxID=1055687 RepID=G0U215_TRYVY|nr:hypothetical protein TRVL_06234 [Trypanosoma vivax]KAH8618831.1 hypothetical protein ERJ75_000257400 [Trypanosoma vivax]CCC50318.1 conserved hypothetical protein [Trypanosoma vivax Y486]